MLWNWQQPDWPHFKWNKSRLQRAEEYFLIDAGTLRGTVKYLRAEEQEHLAVEAMSTEAVTTSEIEGEILDRASVQSSIRRQLGLAADDRRAGPAERGVAEMMVDLFRTYSEPLSHDGMFRWHQMLVGGRRDLREIGRYRSLPEPMQVVSGAIHEPRVHFEAPPSAGVFAEMNRFIAWFNRTAPDGTEPLPALTRAGLVHLYFVSIHPFEDGNGRIARALAEKSLGQSIGEPTLAALAATILIKRKEYYAALEAANKRNEVTPWLAWFGATIIEAQRRTLALVDFIIRKTLLLDRVHGHLNDRQEKALLRMLREGPAGFKGGLSAANYRSLTGASPATATRDLANLVEQNAMIRVGEHKHARYHLDLPITAVLPVSIDGIGNVITVS
jgi:Fic family protein